MADRDIDMLTNELNIAYIDTSNLDRESIVRQLKKRFPTGFSLQDLINGGLISAAAVIQTRMESVINGINGIRSTHEEIDQQDDSRMEWDWQEELLCEIGSLVDNVQLPINQLAIVETLMRLYVDYEVSVTGVDFLSCKWTFNTELSK
jgi:hypothetical protein